VMTESGHTRVFYGVTEDGMQGAWAQFISDEEPDIVEETTDD
jgi:hypothetical protein